MITVRQNLALRRLERDRYDVIISDMEMPGMEGPAWEQGLAPLDPALAERIIFIAGDLLSPTLEPFVANRKGRCFASQGVISHWAEE